MDVGTKPYTVTTTGFYDYPIVIKDSEYPSVSSIVSQVVAECESVCSTDYEKALWLHDWLINNADYDYSYSYCSAEGVLARGKGTCEAYHRAYVMLLEKAGIKTGRITGNNHVWTAALLDGDWTQIDTTWDDMGSAYAGSFFEHLYFGLNDELMSQVHSDHTGVVAGYASTTLDENYFIKSGEIAEWSDPFVSQIRVALDAGEEEFSLTVPSAMASSVRDVIYQLVAYQLNKTDWGDAQVTITYANGALNCTAVYPESDKGDLDENAAGEDALTEQETEPAAEQEAAQEAEQEPEDQIPAEETAPEETEERSQETETVVVTTTTVVTEETTTEKVETPAEPERTETEKVETPAEPEKTETVEVETPAEPEKIETEEVDTPAEPEKIETKEVETPAEPEKSETEEVETPAEPEKTETVEVETPAEPEKTETEEVETPAEPEKTETEEVEIPTEPEKTETAVADTSAVAADPEPAADTTTESEAIAATVSETTADVTPDNSQDETTKSIAGPSSQVEYQIAIERLGDLRSVAVSGNAQKTATKVASLGKKLSILLLKQLHLEENRVSALMGVMGGARSHHVGSIHSFIRIAKMAAVEER
jgi:hypothetical protein